MLPKSLRLLQQAVRINPTATLRAIAQEHPKSKDDLAEALIDVYAETGDFGSKSWTPTAWEAMMNQLDNDPSTLVAFMDTPEVRALIRAQEVARANA